MKALDCNLQCASDNWQGAFAQHAMGFRQLARCLCTTCNGLPTIGKVPLHNVQCASDNWQGTFAQRAMRFRQLARCRCTACKTDLTIVKVPLHKCFHTPSDAKRHCCDSPLKPQNDILFMQPFMSMMAVSCFHGARNTHNLRIGLAVV